MKNRNFPLRPLFLNDTLSRTCFLVGRRRPRRAVLFESWRGETSGPMEQEGHPLRDLHSIDQAIEEGSRPDFQAGPIANKGLHLSTCLSDIQIANL